MNETHPHFIIDPLPILPTRRCRFMARMLGWGLSYGNFIIAAAVWYWVDWFFALGALLLGFIIFGVVRSKLRNDSIPPTQRETPYNDYAIATWYLSRNHCLVFRNDQDSL